MNLPLPARTTLAIFIATGFTVPAQAQVDFGDNSSRWSNDGECDDPRFVGRGMASTLLDQDMYADADDCRSLYERGRIELRSEFAETTAVRNVGARGTSGGLTESGRLERSDQTLQSGEYMDIYEFSGAARQSVTIDLRSDDFDTYVLLVSPDGNQLENDDFDDDVGHSRIETELTETGTYEVVVTSYEPGERGSYRLDIDQSGGAAQAPRRNRDATGLDFGRQASGRLEAGDSQLDSGEYQDNFGFSGTAGQSVRVELSSSQFDTYVALITPGGDVIENDDYEGRTDLSVIEMGLPETGRYSVIVTSYEPGESGTYEVMISELATVAPARNNLAGRGQRSGGHTYGIFVGISDYPGSGNDLDFTAEDAIRVRDALVRSGDMDTSDAITLTDSAATIGEFRSAVGEVSTLAGPDDTIVIFYSGHGDRVVRDGGPESSDPDALNETIELYDGAITDDDLREMLSAVQAGTTLLLLDSCFSGGFAKDIISMPGRMGLFSSEEDVTSQVAVKFRAGGYLAHFLAEGIGERLADEDNDGAVTALELSEYVHLRYRNDVKSSSPDDYVRTGGPAAGYQHLVVDRGSIGPYDVLFP